MTPVYITADNREGTTTGPKLAAFSFEILCGWHKGVTRGARGIIPRAPNHYAGDSNDCEGRQKVPIMSQILSSI